MATVPPESSDSQPRVKIDTGGPFSLSCRIRAELGGRRGRLGGFSEPIRMPSSAHVPFRTGKDLTVHESAYEFLQRAGKPRICVIGDMMLDTYVWGRVDRISPEGPIAVLHTDARRERPGGAGSAAAMLAALGARTLPVGIIGSDAAGRALRRQMEQAGMDADGLVPSDDRPTTTKTRFLGYVQSAGRAQQQLLRVDEETTRPLSPAESDAVFEAARAAIGRTELVVLQDMGKGLLDGGAAAHLIAYAREQDKRVVVDPERAEDYSPYAGAACILPNRFEAELATGMELRHEQHFRGAAEKLLGDLALEAAIIKLDREGMYCATAAGERVHVRAAVRDVADVTGAGDMVTAAISLALAAGADCRCAVELANCAAGIEVGCHGATPLSRARVLEALQYRTEPTARKIIDRKEMRQLRERLRGEGVSVAFTNGCFDLLHLGHVQLIRCAREQADALIVGLNTDSSTRRLKGAGRPINDEGVRARVLSSLADVDYVVLFDEQSVLPLIEELRPDVLVKGGDYDKSGVVGADFVESYGGRVVLAPVAKGFSTTDIIDRIASNGDAAP